MRCWNLYKNKKKKKRALPLSALNLIKMKQGSHYQLAITLQRALQDSVWSRGRYLALSKLRWNEDVAHVVKSAEDEFIERLESRGMLWKSSSIVQGTIQLKRQAKRQRPSAAQIQHIQSRTFSCLRVHVNTQTHEVQNQMEQSVNTSGIHFAARLPNVCWSLPAEEEQRKTNDHYTIKHNFRGCLHNTVFN